MKQDNDYFSISNKGALLFAKRLTDFPRLERKALRIVQYDGINRLKMIRNEIIEKGYVSGFEYIIKYIEMLVTTGESIKGALREKEMAYPTIAIREIVANTLIHQELTATGTGPVIELFSDRLEATNPGIPLVDVMRNIDNPPKSRNEKIASLMRRLRICEELGIGWDKIIISCELKHLPAPKIDLYEQNTKVTLFSEIPFSNISPESKLWACYLHACIKYVEGDAITNSSLRTRFGLKDTFSGSMSRLIRDTVDAKLIKPLDPTTAPRYMKYVPFWA